MKKHKISFCTVSMNRSNHIKATLKKNIEDNKSYTEVEFVLVDYNSSDGLEEWVKLEMRDYINQGILKYYRTTEPNSFHRSHSRNVAFKLANGNIVCNLDADNFLGKDFAYFINYQFSFNQEIFLTSGIRDGSYGRVCVKKNDFLELKGYDENISGWGYEDDDFYDRLSLIGKKRIEFINDSFTKIIEHGIDECFNNDENVLVVKDIYIQQVNPTITIILFLLKNNKFKYGQVFKQNEYAEIELTDIWENGTYNKENNRLKLTFSCKKDLNFKINNDILILKNESPFHLVSNKVLKNKILILLTSLENKKYYQEKKEKVFLNNNENWGNANLTLNFNNKIYI